MHILLTDRLTCPRCGPRFGLILLADRMEERRVLEGALGCPNCRDRFPVREGFGDLRAPPRAALEPEVAADPAPVGADTVAAVAAALGAAEGAGVTVLVGEAVGVALPLSKALAEVELVALDARTRAWPEAPRINRMTAAPGLPFFDGVIRGVVLHGGPPDEVLAEAARILAPRHRVVVLDPEPDLADRLAAVGLPETVAGPGILVAAR